MASAITLLTTESLAIIIRGSPVQKLIPMPAMFTASISMASTLSRRWTTAANTERMTGTTLLSASDSHRLRPSASRIR